ncbi:hypothetical protein RDI58_022088 [Solanum bulbocastanum]|uniref:Uncharacterized protein n=1 Tax=Solanum bulbocastanum TaxID=147425 RepID=A0AAN8Y5B8_SOLBU
MSKNLCSYGQ